MSERLAMAYAGAVHHEGQILHAYYQLDESGAAVGDAQLYAQPLAACDPGTVCSFEVQGAGSVVVRGSAVRVGRFSDAKAVAEWQARDKAVLAAEQAEVVELSSAFSCMEPVREAYRRLDPLRRGVLLAQVVRYLCEPQ